MKKFLCALFALCMSCALWAEVFWANPSTGEPLSQEQGGLAWTYMVMEDGNISITSGSPNQTAIPKETAGKITVPTTIAGKSVTEIGRAAFQGCNRIISVIIPEGVTHIGFRAFEGCQKLVSVQIPQSMKSIFWYAFLGCSSLESLIIPDAVTSIGDAAFASCINIKFLKLPLKRPSIGDDAFSGVAPETVIAGYWTYGTEYSTQLGSERLKRLIIPSEEKMVDWDHDFPVDFDVPVLVFLGLPGWFGKMPHAQGKMFVKKQYVGKFSGGNRRVYSIDVFDGAKMLEVASFMRNPKTMEITYRVESDKTKVAVRAVAYKDGIRSWKNLVWVKAVSSENGEPLPDGLESVIPNVPHTFLWDVSRDWNFALEKVAVEVLASEGRLLPVETVTIPAKNGHPELIVNRLTPIDEWQLIDALTWYVAALDPALSVVDGVLKLNGTPVANDNGLISGQEMTVLTFLYGKMGYRLATDEERTYAGAVLRENYPNSGIERITVKVSSAEKK